MSKYNLTLSIADLQALTPPTTDVTPVSPFPPDAEVVDVTPDLMCISFNEYSKKTMLACSFTGLPERYEDKIATRSEIANVHIDSEAGKMYGSFMAKVIGYGNVDNSTLLGVFFGTFEINSTVGYRNNTNAVTVSIFPHSANSPSKSTPDVHEPEVVIRGKIMFMENTNTLSDS